MDSAESTYASVALRVEGTETGWAHASGWMQLSGVRRRLSCVLPWRNDAGSLAAALPALTDALTEAGYPWELLIIDAGGGADFTRQPPSRIDGVRYATSPRPISRAQALVAGLACARGDAVVLLDLTHVPLAGRIPGMVSRWDEGDEVVSGLESCDGHPASRALLAIDSSDFGLGEGHLLLLDRRVVDELLPTR
jgi:polyisoprenyl-phosphate glycosyltransferase